MAHKALVNGTSYGVAGGMTLVEGTSYSIKNGKVLVDGTEYGITFALPPALLDMWSGSSSGNTINCITYAEGYWVVGGVFRSGSTEYGRIAYATSLNGPWTTKDLWNASSGLGVTLNCITYANGYWVAGGANALSYYGIIAYATSLDGTWSTKNVWTGSKASPINCITYAEGFWVVGGAYYSSSTSCDARIAYATTPSGTWTTKKLFADYSAIGINSITYADGYWVACGTYKSSSSTSNSDASARIAYATTPSGTWTTKDLFTGYSGTTLYCITYVDGYWVVCGSYRYSTSDWYARIACATSLNGTWTTIDVFEGYSGTKLTSIVYADGYWVATGSQQVKGSAEITAVVAYATSLEATWVIQSRGPDVSYWNCITYAEGYWVVGGNYRPDTSNYYARVTYATSPDDFIAA